MSVIAVLPNDVADQIAAGEVVERPASAVKELIENAFDAGATAIAVDIGDGGRGSIRVSDDGCGMDRADAMLALERHATSKIRRTEDLVGIRSFGFRGEALPAIASVAELLLETAPDNGGATRVLVSGGSVTEVGETTRQRGTTVTVTRLFFNVPARLKFMRGTRSEWRAVVDAVTSIALARRDAHITVTHDGRSVFSLPLVSSLRQRVGGVWGAPYAESLVDVLDGTGAARVAGLVERPADVGTRTRRVYLAVNGRAIRDGGIVRAAEAAYRSTVPAGMRPSLFLEMTVPVDAVDVNVHPAKAEVRFRDRWPIERAVETAVRHALGTLSSAAALAPRVWVGGGLGMGHPSATLGMPVDALTGRADVDRGGTGDAGLATWRGAPSAWTRLWDARGTGEGLFGTSATRSDIGPADVRADADGHPEAVHVPPLQQLRRTYLVFETDDGLVFIDQHSAHERILYEQFLVAFQAGHAPAQRLLFPLTLHLSPAAAEALDTHRDHFIRLGFDISAFGGQSAVVHAVPTPHPRFDAERCLRETLDALTGDRVPSTAARHERLIATMSCKAAIKAGDELSSAEMRALYVALARTTLPAHDVHGRSTIVRMGWDELERRFGRR
jgi:DNA mismatch repair protein MutL